ncbi:MAG: hypothetical protein BAA04_03155 [Firmicutes bacterium ZCTH02-B6]|nr:MAG: hypothetical protein BAA04_03155 [Firmicutes bacterium ZCTH02-B6]
MLTIDVHTARRFILGKQALWPGRRFQGVAGTEQAMRAMEYLQLDPLQVVARSHDIALYSRVIDYSPGMWEIPTYQERRFFDWGGWLATRPMEELPHWRVVMRRERDGGPDVEQRVSHIGQEHAAAIKEMRQVLRERGTVSNRDFDMASRTRTNSYRGRKDSALALYYLWRTGEAMTHHRENFERVYALTEAVAPPELLYESPEDVADRFLIKKEIAFHGLARLGRASDAFQRGVPFSKARRIVADLMAAGEVVEVRVEGWKGSFSALAADVPVLEELMAGRVPDGWKPLEAATDDEATFLAPLDPVSARGRAKALFGFDYVWEVYKPEHQRRYGYYTLPVLWGDRLVARFDSRLDRPARRLVLHGLWLEEETQAADEAFVEALAAGFRRFLRFLGAETLDASAVQDVKLRGRLAAVTPG